LARPGVVAGIAAVTALLGMAVIAYVLARISHHLPLGLDPSIASARYPQFAAPTFIGFQISGLIFFGSAAIGFMRRDEWNGDGIPCCITDCSDLVSLHRYNLDLYSTQSMYM